MEIMPQISELSETCENYLFVCILTPCLSTNLELPSVLPVEKVIEVLLLMANGVDACVKIALNLPWCFDDGQYWYMT